MRTARSPLKARAAASSRRSSGGGTSPTCRKKPILTGKDVAEAIRLPWTLAIRGKGGKAEQLLPDERIRTTLDAMGCEDIDLARAT